MLVLADAANAAAPATGAAPAPGAPAGAAPAAGCGGGIGSFAPFILIFAVFYFMLIRPQQKKQKETQDWLKNLKKDDEVVTSGGVLGKITGLTDTTVTLEVQEKVRLKILRSAVAGPAPKREAPAAPTK
jgi:preprotein translocase subunit YajC